MFPSLRSCLSLRCCTILHVYVVRGVPRRVNGSIDAKVNMKYALKHAPFLLVFQAELSVTIEALREKLSQTAQTATPEVGVGDIHLAPRVFDRRRARAVVEAIDPSKGTCTVSWKYPRQKGEIPCRFWKEVRILYSVGYKRRDAMRDTCIFPTRASRMGYTHNLTY